MLKTTQIQIEGMHCQSCKTLIETEVGSIRGVKSINVDYQAGKCKVEFDSTKIHQKTIFQSIEKLGYKVIKKHSPQQMLQSKSNVKKWIVIGILLVIFTLGYSAIKYFGFLEILSKLNEQKISYWLILLIGFLASFHCVGMCGGLVVTYTTSQKKEEQSKISYLPHIQYNLGRMISYTVIGAILGGFGSFFAINPTFTGIITLVAGGFMILMGLSLTTGFKWLEKIKLKTPAFIAKYLYSQKNSKKTKGPFVIGFLNGFMPCGPLQAIELYALGTGNIIQGALSMGIYALGTIPLMFGFGSFISLISNRRIQLVMKISGIVVIVLGLFMLNRGLINFGYGFRGFIPQSSLGQKEYVITGDVKEYQTINMDLTYRGYEPNLFYIKKDIPVRWIINVKQMSGCTDEIIMPDYNIKKTLEYGENIVEFLPDKTGEIKFSCWMQMVWGKFIVTEGDEQPNSQNLEKESLDLSPGGTCGGSGTCGGGCGASNCGCSRIKSSN